jgi:16S rRNA (guanine966-N2)-methyltransferase
MRVIGGEARGHRLKAPKGQELRPTSSRVKEALFNLLPHDLSGARILDLFAGTGSLSAEALSRGAAEAVLIDSSHASAKIIRDNMSRLRLSARTKIWVMPVIRAVRQLAKQRESFDIVFLDPPYERGAVASTIAAAAATRLLRRNGILVAEHSRREELDTRYGSLTRSDQRRYGQTLLSFYKYEDATEEKNQPYGT